MIFIADFSEGVLLEFENSTCVGRVVTNGKDYIKYIFDGIGRYIYGTLSFVSKNYQYSVPIKKSIRPLMWGFMGIGTDNSIIWDNSPLTINTKDLQNYTDANLVISINDSGFDNVTLKILLYANKKKILNAKKIDAENYCNYRIPFNAFLTDMQVTEDSSFKFVLEVMSPNGKKICECLIAKIQEDIIYSDLNTSVNDDIACFNWSEQGSKIDRELVLYNCCMPWERPQVFSIENGVCECTVELKCLFDSMYGATIRTADVFSFFDTELDIPQIAHMKRFVADIVGKKLSGIKKILTDMLENSYGNKHHNCFNDEIKNLVPDFSKESIEALCLSYIFFKKNNVMDETIKLNVNRAFKKLIMLYSRDKYTVLKIILNIELTSVDFIKLASAFNMLCIKITNGCSFSPIERDKIWKYIPELAFVIDVQIKANASRICNWIGDNVINGIVEIKADCSMHDCMSKILANDCKCDQIKININEDVLGSIKHKIGFFNYLSKEYFSAKRLEKLNNIDLFRRYEQQSGQKSLKIFGKSYFITVQEWISSMEDPERKKIEENLKKVFEESVNRKYIEDNHPLIFRTLSLRADSEHQLEYYLGMIVFMECLCKRGLFKDNNTLEKGITYIHKKYNSLFLRDLVVFESYFVFGGVK